MTFEAVVELEGVNGEWFTLAGPRAGDRGVYLATDVKGLFDPPVKVVYEEPGNYPGARYLSHRVLRRDVTFAVWILNDDGASGSWLSRDSEWRKAWAFDRDCKLYVTTPHSGTRWLKVRLLESPEVSMITDPNMEPMTQAVMVVVAGDPFWYEDDIIYEAVTKQDTRFDPSIFTPPWPWEELPQEELTINVDPSDGKGGLNPTDQYIWLKWTVPGSSEPIPNWDLGLFGTIDIPWATAPFTQFVIPDYSFEDEAQANRRVKTPGLIIGEDCVIDTDPREEQFSAANEAPVWARTNGVRFKHPVPPYTKGREFKVTASGCAPGEMITLRIPRPWSRPWGLE